MTHLTQAFGRMAVASLALISTTQAKPLLPYPNQIEPEAEPAAKVPLRLMPLGASITYGVHSTDGNGYRRELHDLLVEGKYNVTMVGSRKHGTMKNNENEGWTGLRIEQVDERARAAVPSRLPNVFTVNAGTNDCLQNFNVDTAGQRMDDLLEYLWDASPGSTIILSTLVINLSDTTEARVEKVNEQIRALAQKKEAEGRRIVLAEMHAADGPQRRDIGLDGTHPVNAGYDKMGKVWYRSIQTAASKEYLQPPGPLS